MKLILCSVLLASAVTIESKRSQEILQRCLRETKIPLEEVAQLGKTLKGKSDDDMKSLGDAAKQAFGEEKVSAFVACMKTNFGELVDKCVKNVTVTDEEKTKLEGVMGTILESSGGTRKAVSEKVVEILGAERAETLAFCAQREMDD